MPMNSDAETRLLLRFRRAFAREPMTSCGMLSKSSERKASGVILRKPDFFSSLAGKCRRIPGENERCVGSDRRRDNMAVVRIRQGNPWNVLLVTADQRRRKRIIHQAPRDQQTLFRDARRIGRQVPDPFVMDRVGPARFDKAIHGGLNNDIPEMKGI